MVEQLVPVRVAWKLCGIGKTKFYNLADAGVFTILKQGWRSYVTERNLVEYQQSLPKTTGGGL